MTDSFFEAMRVAWQQASSRFGAYSLVMPGSPRFICQPDVCTAYCCHAYSVNLGEAEVARFQKFEAVELIDFLEVDEDGKPLTLPLAQPYLLARSEGHCKQLAPNLGCGAYEGRPNACRLYPHFVVFWDAEAGRARTTPSRQAAAAFGAASRGNMLRLAPLLLGHIECPGFTGEPLSEAGWFQLFRETYQLQYGAV